VLSDPRLTSPAPEILAHLISRRQDSIDGIQWGVLHASIRNLEAKVAETVEELVEWGYLEKELSSSDGTENEVFYHISPGYLAELQQQQPKNSPPDATSIKN
jgi:hypothetical protein